MINKVTLIGNVGKDPEVKYLENQKVVAKFSVATNESYKDKAGEWVTNTEWHDILCWNKLAEIVEKNCKKGKMVYIEGKLTHRKYQDKEGNDRYITEVVANTFRLLEKREGGSNQSSFPTANDAPKNQQGDGLDLDKTQQQIDDANTVKGKSSKADDDLPF